MAKIRSNGTLSGRVGNVIYSSWKGIPYQRSRPVIINPSRTPAQQAQRARFALAINFVLTMQSLLNITYRKLATGMTALNKAQSLVLKYAVSGSYPNFFINYKNAFVSRGRLPNVFSPVAVQSAAGRILFAWTSNIGLGYTSDRDRAILVAYCEDLQRCIYSTDGVFRKDEKGLLKVPGLSGKTVHTWIAFISEDEKEISDSMYTGEVNIM